MRIAIAGKGGTGKTTLTGTLARALGQEGRSVLAVDADSNPNLATVLGVPPAQAEALIYLPRDLMQRRTEPDGSTKVYFSRPPSEVIAQYGVEGPDGVRLVVMGKVQHGGAGCMCGAHGVVRGLLGEIVAQGDYTGDVLVDMEAGLEHFSRGTGRHVSCVLAVLEPYYRSMETASRVADLAKELGIAEVVAVSNKVRDRADRDAINDFCAKRGMPLLGEIPHDAALADAERHGLSPIEHSPDSPAVRAVRSLAKQLMVSAH